MTLNNKPETSNHKKSISITSSEPKVESYHDKGLALFNKLGFSFTYNTYRLCAENNVSLDELIEFTPYNNLLLIKLATGKEDEEVYKVIEEWLKHKFSIKYLHSLLLLRAREDGFFTSTKEMETYGKIIEQDPLSVTLLQPTLTSEVSLYNLQEEE